MEINLTALLPTLEPSVPSVSLHATTQAKRTWDHLLDSCNAYIRVFLILASLVLHVAVKRWKGPDALVIGWIPFQVTGPHAPGFQPGLATTLLFQSGNPVPPPGFADYAGFANWLHPLNPQGTKEYRGALYLEGVAAEFPDDGTPPRLDRTANGSFVGYTPLRFYVGTVNIAPLIPQVPQYLGGVGPSYAPTSACDPGGNWVKLRYRAEFKLSWLPNLLSRVLLGTWAPYAWCEILYRVEESGQIHIRVEGSAIPSQRLYVDWTMPAPNPAAGVIPEYDMLTATRAAVAGFIQTTGWGCTPAPGGTRLGWRGAAAAW